MSDASAAIRASINCITRLLEFIRNCPYTDLAPAFAFQSAAPLIYKARGWGFEHLKHAIVAYLEHRDPAVLRGLGIVLPKAGESSHWLTNWISDDIFDAAVDLNIITDVERSSIRSRIAPPHTLGDADVSPYLRRIMDDVDLLQRVLTMLGQTPVTPTRSGTPVPPTTAQPDLQIDTLWVRKELENRFRGTIERDFDGTLGHIYVLRNPPNTDPERIAVKTVDPTKIKAAASHNALQRMAHEARHWIAYRNSPFIISPFYIVLVHGWPFMAMPYRECTMRQYIDGAVPHKSLSESLALMIHAACGLEFAYSKGLRAHQDLKPENILLQELPERSPLPKGYPFRWHAQLADFGIANGYSELGLRWGSRPYQAPEQYEKGADLSYVDVFACGVILCELMTGKHPIGEVTSDVWPVPKAGKSSQWRRENKWKEWARGGSTRPLEISCGLLRDLIVACLSANPASRPSIASFKRTLLKSLKRADAEAYENLLCCLAGLECYTIFNDALNVDDDIDDRYQQDYMKRLMI